MLPPIFTKRHSVCNLECAIFILLAEQPIRVGFRGISSNLLPILTPYDKARLALTCLNKPYLPITMRILPDVM